MQKNYIDLTGKPFTVDFTPHDISKYENLYHVTWKENVSSIKIEGLKRFQPSYKSLIDTDLIFLSYPVNGTTGDLFRFQEEIHAIIVLDAIKLHEAGYLFYDDYFSKKDQSSLRNHLAIDRDIPAEFIMKVITF